MKIRQRHLAITTLDYTSVMLNWRGVWSMKSWEHLVRLRVLRSQDAKMISTRILIGTLNGWHIFNHRTTNIHGRGRAREEGTW